MSSQIQSESAQERFDRKWGHVSQERKYRGWDQRSQERKDREFFPHTEEPEEVDTDIYSETYKDKY